MKIVKCLDCGKYVHKANRCLYCGNVINGEEIERPVVHENVVAEYLKVLSLIEGKKFSEAISHAHTVIEWMPNLAGIFWLRLLAKNECVSVVDLLRKGFDCEEDADFCNALLFSTGGEHDAYYEIQKTISNVQKVLKKEIISHQYDAKRQTDIFEIKKNMQKEMDERRQKLYSLWLDLEETENALYSLEMDCQLLSKEHRDDLDESAKIALKIKEETYMYGECTEEQFYRYQVKLGQVLQQSEQAKEAIENIKNQHPWVKQFNELVDKREEQVKYIEMELALLKDYGVMVQKTLDEINEIENLHREVLLKVEEYDFQDAALLLGKGCFNEVFRRVGLGVDIQL